MSEGERKVTRKQGITKIMERKTDGKGREWMLEQGETGKGN